MSNLDSPIKEWSWEKARHLLFRAGFGGRFEEIQHFLELGHKESVEELLKGSSMQMPQPQWLDEDRKLDPKKLRSMGKEALQEIRKTQHRHLREMIGQWVKRMISAPTASEMLHQKMVFFWHSHFATSIQKVKATPFIFDQLKLFHEKALGNFKELLHAIIRDPAMLRYLDNDQNRKGRPNENLARELMELFSLGTGNYTEKDIREGARALTGWSLEPYQFRFNAKAHDDGEKIIFEKKGKWDGKDFVDMILEKPACAEFITKKLWVYFGNENPKPALIQEVANQFRDSKYDIKTLLRAIFTHPEFYAPEVMGVQIKSPIQLVVGTTRTLNLAISNPEFFGRMLLMMGQVPYFPPNVKGWPGGRAWIDTSRLVTRYTFAGIVGQGKLPAEIDPRMQGDADLDDPESPTMEAKERTLKKKTTKERRQRMLPPNLQVRFDTQSLISGERSASTIVDRALKILLPLPATDAERQKLIENFETAIADKQISQGVQKLVGEIMLLPAYQLC